MRKTADAVGFRTAPERFSWIGIKLNQCYCKLFGVLVEIMCYYIAIAPGTCARIETR